MTIHSPITAASRDAAVFPVLLRVLKLTRAFQNMRLAEIGLQNGQDEFLLALEECGPKSVSQIANDLGVRASTVSKMIDVLAGKGLAERVGSDRDHRLTFVVPTARGREICRTIRDAWDDIDRELIRSAAALDTAALRRDLEALEVHVDKRLKRLR